MMETRISDAGERRVIQWFKAKARYFVIVLIFGLFALNILLFLKNRNIGSISGNSEPGLLSAGERVPSFSAATVSGVKRKINFADSEKTVFLVFSPECPACERVAPIWRKIEHASLQSQYQIYGLSLGDKDKSLAFLEENNLNIESIPNIDARMRERYKIFATPITLLIDKYGTVESVWLGAFEGEIKHEVERYFGISPTM